MRPVTVSPRLYWNARMAARVKPAAGERALDIDGEIVTVAGAFPVAVTRPRDAAIVSPRGIGIVVVARRAVIRRRGVEAHADRRAGGVVRPVAGTALGRAIGLHIDGAAVAVIVVLVLRETCRRCGQGERGDGESRERNEVIHNDGVAGGETRLISFLFKKTSDRLHAEQTLISPRLD